MTTNKESVRETLEECGFSFKPGSTKGRQSSVRFYIPELTQIVTALIDKAVIAGKIEAFDKVRDFGEDNDYDPTMVAGYIDGAIRTLKAQIVSKEVKP